jgi:hypothetical protein
MAVERRYVLILDRKLDYIRLFRADCPARPDGKPLWEGDGLRRAYDAMKELNARRKPVRLYHVCSIVVSGRKPTFRVFKSDHPKTVPPKVWERISVHTEYRAAIGAVRLLRSEATERAARERQERRTRKEAAKAQDAAMMSRLRKVGVKSKRLPKLTEKDLRYLEWIEAKRQLFEDAA